MVAHQLLGLFKPHITSQVLSRSTMTDYEIREAHKLLGGGELLLEARLRGRRPLHHALQLPDLHTHIVSTTILLVINIILPVITTMLLVSSVCVCRSGSYGRASPAPLSTATADLCMHIILLVSSKSAL